MADQKEKGDVLDVASETANCRQTEIFPGEHDAILIPLTDEEEILAKKIRKKVDLLVMPTIIVVYLLNWIDRNNYAAARLQGLEDDLNLSPDQFQTGLSILYVGYLLAQVPANMLLNYCGRPSWFIATFAVLWGLVTLLTSQVQGFAGIMVCRLILGVVEAPLFPGVLFYLSKWYTKTELSLRISMFFSASFIAGAFGNLIAAGILSGMAGVRGLSAWQWLYILEGVASIVVGISAGFLLPDFPETWKFLTPEMKAVVEKRMTLEAASLDVDEGGAKTQIQGFKLAFSDVKVYIFAAIYLCITGASGFQNFFPTLTATLGYSRIVSLLLVAPPFIFMTAYSICHSLISDRLQNRFWFVFYPVPISIIGFVVFMTTDAFAPRYFSVFLMMFCLAINAPVYSWVASSMPRPPAKRAVSYAFINAIGNSASIWTPFTYRDQDSPHFELALGTNIGLMVIAGLLAILLRYLLQRDNRSMADREAHETAEFGSPSAAAQVRFIL